MLAPSPPRMVGSPSWTLGNVDTVWQIGAGCVDDGDCGPGQRTVGAGRVDDVDAADAAVARIRVGVRPMCCGVAAALLWFCPQ